MGVAFQLAAPILPRILVVDDDREDCDLLAKWLTYSGYDPLTSTSALNALEIVSQERVDVVVTDLRMPWIDGLQLLGMLKMLRPALPVIVLTGHAKLEDTLRAIRTGRVADFLLKPLRHMRDLNAAIEGALLSVIAPRAGAATGAGFRKEAGESREGGPDDLTDMEHRLMELLAAGLDNRRIALELHYSEKTVRNYLSRVYEKLDVGSRLEAVARWRAMAPTAGVADHCT